MNRRTILFLNDRYIGSIDDLKNLLKNPMLINKEEFRKEFLAAFRDKVIENWLKERNHSYQLQNLYEVQQDNVLFGNLFELFIGEKLTVNLESNFSKLGEFLRCEVGSVKYIVKGGVLSLLGISSQERSITFVFRVLQPDNNIRHFDILSAEHRTVIFSFEIDWSQTPSGQEKSVQIPAKEALLNGHWLLVESASVKSNDKINQLCECTMAQYRDLDFIVIKEGISYRFVYLPDTKQWVGLLHTGRCDIQEAKASIKGLSAHIPDKDEALKWMSKRRNFGENITAFWVLSHEFPLKTFYYDSIIKTVDEVYRAGVTKQLLVAYDKIPTLAKIVESAEYTNGKAYVLHIF